MPNGNGSHVHPTETDRPNLLKESPTRFWRRLHGNRALDTRIANPET